MFNIVLFEPEIPPNTGNVMRLCANTGSRLHLVRPLGFSLADKKLERAGMDYRSAIDCSIHDNWEACLAALAGCRLFALSTRAAHRYDTVQFRRGDAFVFGPETRGLPTSVLASIALEHRLVVPMRAGSRSINLSNAVAIVLYEAWRQLAFGDS
jgi:tRNA (cytidine/uridine-2'-O-)-methyltransferase